MLHIPELQNSSSVPHVTPDRPVRTTTGRRLNRLVKEASPTDRALFAYDLARGVVQILRPTYAQAAMLTKASPGYVGTVSRLTEDERVRLARGQLSLSRLHRYGPVATDAEIDRLVAMLGPERVLAALDRATAPSLSPAE